MTTFKEIRGKLIRTLDTDPTPATNYQGEIWYNKTIGVLKAAEVLAAAWSSGGNLTTSRFQAGMVGTKSAALIIGSENPGGDIATVEEYNGSSWSPSPSINTARQGLGSTGTISAAIAMGGLIAGPNVRQTLSEEWNGTAWTAGNALTEAGRSNISGAATQTAGVAMFSGELTPDSNSGKYHEQYDGTSWTASTKCPTVRVQGSYAGSQTAGIGFGGRANSPGAPSVRISTSDAWNGSTWTSGPSGITARSGHSSHGTDSSAIFARGSTNPGTVVLTSTEEYDGTSFSATPSVTNTGQGIEGGHAQPSPVGAAWIAGGSPVQNQTEEYNSGLIGTRTLTTS